MLVYYLHCSYTALLSILLYQVRCSMLGSSILLVYCSTEYSALLSALQYIRGQYTREPVYYTPTHREAETSEIDRDRGDAVCCSALQCAAVVLQCATVCCSALQSVTVCCRCAAVCCSILGSMLIAHRHTERHTSESHRDIKESQRHISLAQ